MSSRVARSRLGASRAAAQAMSPTGGAIGAIVAVQVAAAMVTPLLPIYAVETLGASLGAVGLVVAAPVVGMILVQPVAGQVADHFGRRSLITVGIVVMMLATVTYALVPSFAAVVLLRVVAGAGSGLVVVGTLAAVVDESPDGRRGELMSIYTLATNGGGAVGPLLGGALATWTSFSGVIALSALVTGLGTLPGCRVPRPDGVGASSPFRLSHRRLVHPAGIAPGGVLAIGFAGAAAVFTLLPLYLLDIGSQRAGTAIAVFMLSITAVRLLGRQLPDRLGYRRCAVTALVLVGTGLVLMAFARSFPLVLAATAVVGCGHGFGYPSLVSTVTMRCRDDERATALGTFTAVSSIGMVGWSVALGALASAAGMQLAFGLAGVVVALGVLFAARL